MSAQDTPLTIADDGVRVEFIEDIPMGSGSSRWVLRKGRTGTTLQSRGYYPFGVLLDDGTHVFADPSKLRRL